MNEVQYSDYVESCSANEHIFGQDQYYKRNKRRVKPVSENKFNALKCAVKDQLNKRTYDTREEAQEDLEIKIQQMGPITFFLLRALIGWIIGKLLDAYFDEDDDVT